MKLKYIKIMGRSYRFRAKKLDGLAGQCDRARGVITVPPGQEAFEHKDSVIHECLHAILHQQGYTNEYEAEEAYVRPLATGIIALFQDNPELAAWLTEPIKDR